MTKFYWRCPPLRHGRKRGRMDLNATLATLEPAVGILALRTLMHANRRAIVIFLLAAPVVFPSIGPAAA